MATYQRSQDWKCGLKSPFDYAPNLVFVGISQVNYNYPYPPPQQFHSTVVQ